MLESEVAALAQLGAAGLMGWMWLAERRGAAHRERQLSEAHERMMQERRYFESLLAAVRENTRVMALLEGAQERLGRAIERLDGSRVDVGRTQATSESRGGSVNSGHDSAF